MDRRKARKCDMCFLHASTEACSTANREREDTRNSGEGYCLMENTDEEGVCAGLGSGREFMQ